MSSSTWRNLGWCHQQGKTGLDPGEDVSLQLEGCAAQILEEGLFWNFGAALWKAWGFWGIYCQWLAWYKHLLIMGPTPVLRDFFNWNVLLMFWGILLWLTVLYSICRLFFYLLHSLCAPVTTQHLLERRKVGTCCEQLHHTHRAAKQQPKAPGRCGHSPNWGISFL